MLNPIFIERYGDNDLIVIGAGIIALAKKRQTKKIIITPIWRRILKRELDERMKIRHRKMRERREHYYK